jgi:NADPH:quinone reductase-like Zn-dependent oxidoreductase
MRAVVFDRFGEPGEVLQVREVPTPEPGAGQVRVRMIASPINPSDMMSVRGQYGKPPNLPWTPGFEGVGVIDKTGPGFFKVIRGLRPGRRVAVLSTAGGNWGEYVVIPARQAVPVSEGIADNQAASFFVNPATVVVMVRDVLRVPRGAWLMQSAAGSTLGRMILRLARHDGFRTINLVRRREQVDEMKRLGADEVICTSDESVEERVNTITGGKGVLFAIDAVGGTTGSAMVRSLGECGHMLVYGTLSNEPLSVDPRQLIMATRRVEGFWLSIWSRRQRPLRMLRLFRDLNRLIKEGVLASDLGASFPLDQIQAAAKQAEVVGRQGKVLLTMK